MRERPTGPHHLDAARAGQPAGQASTSPVSRHSSKASRFASRASSADTAPTSSPCFTAPSNRLRSSLTRAVLSRTSRSVGFGVFISVGYGFAAPRRRQHTRAVAPGISTGHPVRAVAQPFAVGVPIEWVRSGERPASRALPVIVRPEPQQSRDLSWNHGGLRIGCRRRRTSTWLLLRRARGRR